MKVSPRVRLDEIAEVRLGRQRSPKNHSGSQMRPYLRAANVGWRGLRLTDVKTMNFTDAEMSIYELHPGDLLLGEASGSPTEVGKPAIWNGEIDGCAFQNTLLRVRPSGADSRYLLHFFRHEADSGNFAARSRGVGIRHLGREALAKTKLPLPPIEEQQRIAGILDRADGLRTKRREALALLEDLTQSIFLDMFGGEAFESVSAGALMPEMRNGLSPATAGEYSARVLTLSAVTRGAFDPKAAKQGMFAIDPPSDKRIDHRDFLMCRGNGNRALVGTGVFSTVDRADLVFPDTVIAGRVDESWVELPFLEVAWRQPSMRDQLESAARTTNGTYKINQQSLSKVTLPLPPLDLQRRFAQRTVNIAALRLGLNDALHETNDLFASLQRRAFAGLL